MISLDMGSSMRIIVAHPAQQHSYRLATSLSRAGLLADYVTTVYMKPRSLTRLAAAVLPVRWKKKAIARHCNDLDDRQVVQMCETGGLFVLFFHNIPFLRRWYWQVKRIVEDRFGRKVARYANKVGADAVVCYDGCSTILFEEVKRISPETVCIADMSAANALYLREVFEKDRQLKPDFEESLFAWKRIWDPVDVARTKREIAAADRFLCGSEFVKRSLEYSGVTSDRCEVCHYGVDVDSFPYRERSAKSDGDPLVFVYLGHVSEHKGISYLMDAFESISPDRARLVLVGSVNIPEAARARCGENVMFTGNIPHNEVSRVLLEADIMLFPSLGDGFSLSIMEAFASGLPVVCSENTGAADCIIEGENGFVIPIRDSNALRERIDWFLDNRGVLPQMAEAARQHVLELTWDTYYENAARALVRMVEEGVHG